jgi:hypothetical protein
MSNDNAVFVYTTVASSNLSRINNHPDRFSVSPDEYLDNNLSVDATALRQTLSALLSLQYSDTLDTVHSLESKRCLINRII